MERGLVIRINGEEVDLSTITYDIFSVDSRKRGNLRYGMEVKNRLFERHIRPIYESDLKALIEEKLLNEPLNYDEWTNNRELFKNIALEWFGYLIIDPFFKREIPYPKYIIQSIDDIERRGNLIVISGSAKKLI